MAIGVLKFEPILKERIWGGDRLRESFGKEVPAGKRIGESWEVADLVGECSCVAEGAPLPGMTLRDVLAEHGGEIGFTAEQREQPFGLLVKLLDATETLSVQVHPDAQAARRWAGAQPKTECWYVLNADAGGMIYRGLKAGVTRESLLEALGEGRVGELLVGYAARPGDFHFLPAGTLHALGAGVLVAEIQTPSDTTFRLYDWDRLDEQGRGRELHVEQAMACIDFEQAAHDGEERPVGERKDMGDNARDLLTAAGLMGKARLLVDCEHFAVVHVAVEAAGAGRAGTVSTDVPFVMMALSGEGVISAHGVCEGGCAFRAGGTMLLPVAKEAYLNVSGRGGEFLLACLGR